MSAIQIVAVNARKKKQNSQKKAGYFNLEGVTSGFAEGMKGMKEVLKEEAQAEAKREISEMVYYLIFLLLFTLVTISGNSNQMLHWLGANTLDAFVSEPLPIEQTGVKMTYEDVGTVCAWLFRTFCLIYDHKMENFVAKRRNTLSCIRTKIDRFILNLSFSFLLFFLFFCRSRKCLCF